MKIYTKRGDGGKTGLIGGDEVSKSNERINAYGEVDELNSIIGWCGSAVVADKQLKKMLERENRNLFVLGSWLATPDSASVDIKKSLPEWNSKSVEALETEISSSAKNATNPDFIECCRTNPIKKKLRFYIWIFFD